MSTSSYFPPAGSRLGLTSPHNVSTASMTGGLVQEYQHTMLPSVPPIATLIATVLSILVSGSFVPMGWGLLKLCLFIHYFYELILIVDRCHCMAIALKCMTSFQYSEKLAKTMELRKLVTPTPNIFCIINPLSAELFGRNILDICIYIYLIIIHQHWNGANNWNTSSGRLTYLI